MAKHAALAFNRQLEDLFHRRTHWLRALVSKPGSGRAPNLNRAPVTRGILRLQELASECLATQFARREFNDEVSQRKRWHITASKGRGWRNKQRAFGEWYANEIDCQRTIAQAQLPEYRVSVRSSKTVVVVFVNVYGDFQTPNPSWIWPGRPQGLSDAWEWKRRRLLSGAVLNVW